MECVLRTGRGVEVGGRTEVVSEDVDAMLRLPTTLPRHNPGDVGATSGGAATTRCSRAGCCPARTST